jgi:quercetin dioxygenase-like cupin family protein
MESWDLSSLDVEPHRPNILQSRRDEARSIVLRLPAGESLREHQVHERAHLVVIDGEVEIGRDGSDPLRGGRGLLAIFDPGERHEVHAHSDALLLLVLAPWPGPGHPGARDA